MNQSNSNSVKATPAWSGVSPGNRRLSRSIKVAEQQPQGKAKGKQPNILLTALLVAGALHLVIIFGVTFEDIRDHYIPPSLEVILVKQHNDSEPEKANYLAQHAQTGGGNSETRKRQTAPVSGSEKQRDTGTAPKPVTASSPKETRTAETESITQIFSEHKVRDKEQQKQINQVSQAREDSTLKRRMEIARLTAELAKELEQQASRPKTMYVTASTKQSSAANYMLDWVKKVERVGNINFPAAAYSASGSLVLVVGINQHGGITEVAVKRTSGYQRLDDAAVNIVKMAAPYAPMPASLASETDIIYITRTWQFTRERTLYSY